MAGLLVAAAAFAAAPSQNPDEKPERGRVHRSVPATDEARTAILRWAITHPNVVRRAPGHRLTAVRMTLGNVAEPTGRTRTIATIVLFDHTAGEARRVEIDTVSGEVLDDQRLAGRPQSSREEFQDAVRIIRGDAELARLLDDGGVLDGGFIVDDPAGSPRRIIQLKLLSRDRFTLLRAITVDLTRGVIASSSGVGP